MKTIQLLAALVVAVSSHALSAQEPLPPAAMSEGEVRKVDKEAGKLTLRHGPIANLDMPGMTMVFRAADPKLLDGLQEGDKVRFAAERDGGTLAVTRIEALR